MDESIQQAVEQPGNVDAGGASSAEQKPEVTSVDGAASGVGAGEQGNDAAAAAAGVPVAGDVPAVGGDAPNGVLPADGQSASDTSSSALNASQDVGTEVDASAEPDHKGILETLFADLEGIAHMAKTEIVAVIERAKALL